MLAVSLLILAESFLDPVVAVIPGGEMAASETHGIPGPLASADPLVPELQDKPGNPELGDKPEKPEVSGEAGLQVEPPTVHAASIDHEPAGGAAGILQDDFHAPGCWATGVRVPMERPPDGVIYGFCFEASGRAYLSADETDSGGKMTDACTSPAIASRENGVLDIARETGAPSYCRRAPSRGLVPVSVSCADPGSGGDGAVCILEGEGGRKFSASFRVKRGEAWIDPRRRAVPEPPAGASPGSPPDLEGREPGDVGFLAGRWLSSVDAEAMGVGFPPVYEYVFATDGKARVTIRDRRADGTPLPPCTASAEAQLRSGGILIVRTGQRGADCPGEPERSYPPRVLGCFQSRDGAPPECMLLDEGRRGAGAVFRKALDAEP
ncbi:MAG: hypothetical protein LBQ79_12610 [Deltaproteobacteria bacterium]|jgi:hypothetical protein|nr:hypothetical protein [Deltaproteobacteria bacterium]